MNLMIGMQLKNYLYKRLNNDSRKCSLRYNVFSEDIVTNIINFVQANQIIFF